jgi:hypothetical protein
MAILCWAAKNSLRGIPVVTSFSRFTLIVMTPRRQIATGFSAWRRRQVPLVTLPLVVNKKTLSKRI